MSTIFCKRHLIFTALCEASSGSSGSLLGRLLIRSLRCLLWSLHVCSPYCCCSCACSSTQCCSRWAPFPFSPHFRVISGCMSPTISARAVPMKWNTCSHFSVVVSRKLPRQSVHRILMASPTPPCSLMTVHRKLVALWSSSDSRFPKRPAKVPSDTKQHILPLLLGRAALPTVGQISALFPTQDPFRLARQAPTSP